MKKTVLFILICCCVFGFAGCGNLETELTLEKVTELSEKGEELTWSDFESYSHEDIGSGLYIYRYEVGENYYLLLGGGGTEIPPMYIKLVSKTDADAHIDIRTESVDDFINKLSDQN